MMRTSTAVGFLLAGTFACTPQGPEGPSAINEVQVAAQAFLDRTHAFDYAAMRASATPDFEILIFGQRLDIDSFETLLRGMEESRGGEPLGLSELVDFNTEIAGDVAYATWASPGWLESGIFVRSGDLWLIDRAASIPAARPEE